MVDTLLGFVRAIHESNWDIHTAAVLAALPWMLIMRKSITLGTFRTDIMRLSNTHHAIPDQFVSGKWTIQQHDRYDLSCTASEQVIEIKFNRDSKTWEESEQE